MNGEESEGAGGARPMTLRDYFNAGLTPFSTWIHVEWPDAVVYVCTKHGRAIAAVDPERRTLKIEAGTHEMVFLSLKWHPQRASEPAGFWVDERARLLLDDHRRLILVCEEVPIEGPGEKA